jgi:hypothetical protein
LLLRERQAEGFVRLPQVARADETRQLLPEEKGRPREIGRRHFSLPLRRCVIPRFYRFDAAEAGDGSGRIAAPGRSVCSLDD